MSRNAQAQLMTIVAEKLTKLSGVEFYGDDMSHLPEDTLHFSDEAKWSSGATRISLKYELPDENNLESAVIKMDFSTRVGDKRNLGEVYAIIDALRSITKQDVILYLHYTDGNFADKSFNSMLQIDVSGSGTLLTDLEATDDMINTLYSAYTKGTLSVICIRSIKTIDKKYPEFLKSRGAIPLKGDWWAIIDNE